MLFFGTQVQSGIIGNNPQISQNTTDRDNLPMHIDFRSVYASVLHQWFCIPEDKIREILFKNYQTIPILKSTGCVSSIHDYNRSLGKEYMVVYPNPFRDKITITFESMGGECIFQLFDNQGKILSDKSFSETNTGSNHETMYFEHLPSGVYYLRFQNQDIFQVSTLVRIEE
jgi:hypothetical protein